jgi:hypothetical protein
LTFPENGKLYGQVGDMQNDQDVDKLTIKQLIIARSADKVSITDEMADKLADIVIYLKNHPKSPSMTRVQCPVLLPNVILKLFLNNGIINTSLK